MKLNLEPYVITLSFFTVVLPLKNIASAAEPSTQNKNGYWLFNRTPPEEMRAFSTDRPDKTESPYTVDAGHYQFETDLISAAIDRAVDTGVVTRTFGLNLINLKAGIANFSDLQLILGAKYQVKTDGGTDSRTWSLSDITVRWKLNIFGNDSGDVVFAFMPFIKVPTAISPIGNGKTEGGLIFPFTLKAPWGFSIGTMAQLNVNIDNAKPTTYYPVFIHTFTVDHDIIGTLNGYAEIYSESNIIPDAAWIATFDIGLTWEFVKNWQLDAGVNIGITPAADDWNPFFGLSARF